MTKVFIIVVVDQLGWSDRVHLSQLRSLLGEPVPVSTPYLPTVTETGHATVALGSVPSLHGIIGGETFRRTENGLRHLQVSEHVYEREGFGPLRSSLPELTKKGVLSFVITGKEKVARLLDPRPDRKGYATRVWLRKDPEGYQLKALDKDGEPDSRFLTRSPPKEFGSQADELLTEIAETAIADTWRGTDRVFMFLGLPGLDYLGHKYGHEDDVFRDAVREVDRILWGFLKRRMQDLAEHRYQRLEIVVTGDHGARTTPKIIWPDVNDRRMMLHVDGVVKEIHFPWGDLEECEINGTLRPALIPDGGTMRLLVKSEAVERVVAILRREWSGLVHQVVGHDGLREVFGEDDWTRNIHENWGEVIIFAAHDVGLMKADWLRKGFPRAEHGTLNENDRLVPWWGPNGVEHDALAGLVQRFFDQ